MSDDNLYPKAMYTDDPGPELHAVFRSNSFMGLAKNKDEEKSMIKSGFRLTLDKPKRGPKKKEE